MQKILVIEDDKELNTGISYALKKAGYEVFNAYSLNEAKEVFTQNSADAVLLDVNLPDGEGFSFCQWLKERSQTPVLFLTARDMEEDALSGYEAGAEDYVTKPFSMKILLKKIKVLCRGGSKQEHHGFDDGFLEIDFDKAKAKVCGAECTLTPTEFRMLRFFTEHQGQLLTYSVLLEQLWDNTGAFVDRHTLAVNVNRLRKKIEDDEHRYISNVYGMGYQWLK